MEAGAAEMLSAVLGFLGGLLGGILSFYGAIRADRRANRDLEKDEKRRKKVEIIYNLLGSRYVLRPDYRASPQDVMVFNTAMSLFPLYFFDNNDVRQKFDTFQHSIQRNDPSSNHHLLEMLKSAGREAGLELLDSHIGNVLIVNADSLPHPPSR